VDVAHEVEAPLLTCESVLSEAAFHLASSDAVLTLVSSGMLQIAFDLGENAEKVHELAKRYSDRHADLADLCLIRMSELYPHHTLITVDTDFRVYRRNKREAIPVLCPPRN
jgi:predicted nucleic acid-binding protein